MCCVKRELLFFWIRQDFAWVHDTLGINGIFDCTHQFYSVISQFLSQVFLFAKTDAVLASNRSFEFNRSFYEILVKSCSFSVLFLAVLVKKNE